MMGSHKGGGTRAYQLVEILQELLLIHWIKYCVNARYQDIPSYEQAENDKC